MLVFFGGVDSMNLTSLSLQALCAPVFADLAVDVVIGLQSTYRREVEELVARRPNTTLHDPLPSLAALLLIRSRSLKPCIGQVNSSSWVMQSQCALTKFDNR